MQVDLVFIGDINVMDEERIREEIENAMLTKEEFDDFLAGKGPKPTELPNPFQAVPRCVKI
jgi:hypothetical protein